MQDVTIVCKIYRAEHHHSIFSEYLWDVWISTLESAGKDTTNETRRPVHLPVSISSIEFDYTFHNTLTNMRLRACSI
jgi:hypothetical protein